MKRLLPIALASCVCVAAGGPAPCRAAETGESETQPAPQTQPVPTLQPRLEKLLAAIEAKGKTVTSVRTDLKRTLHLRIWRRTKVATGQLAFRRPDLLRIDLTDPRRESYICDGKSFYEVSEAKRQIIEHTIPPERRGKLLDRPPTNLLIGGPADDLKRQYKVRWLKDDQETITLELVPREGTESDFTRAILVIDRKTLLPRKIHRWLRKKRKTEETHEFSNTQVNVELDPSLFTRPRQPAGWTWQTDPGA